MVNALGAVGPVCVPRVLEELTKSIQFLLGGEGHEWNRYKEVEMWCSVLSRARDPAASSALISFVEACSARRDGAPLCLGVALAASGGTAAIDFLTILLESDSDHEQLIASVGLATIKERRCLPVLTKCLRAGCGAQSFEALTIVCDHQDIELVLDIASHAKDERVPDILAAYARRVCDRALEQDLRLLAQTSDIPHTVSHGFQKGGYQEDWTEEEWWSCERVRRIAREELNFRKRLAP